MSTTNIAKALGALTYKFYFVFIAFNIVITFSTIWFTFKETKKLTLEEIDLLFGGHAAGTIPINSELQHSHVDEKADREIIA
jgi:hypothetical protein